MRQLSYPHCIILLYTAISATVFTKTEQYTPSNIFIGGLGYTGSRLASSIHDAYPNAKISGTVRSIERRDGLLHHSSRPSWLTGNVHVLDIDNNYLGLDTEGVRDLMEADTIIQTVAPIADFDRDPLLAFHDKELLNSANTLQYVAYISSTGVYGNHDGGWVSENDELLCTDAKSLARIRAEMEWGKIEQIPEDTKQSVPRVDCFRCGGIYGPGRGPLFSSLESMTDAIQRVDADKDNITPIKYVNRILVDDICSAILSGMSGNRPFHSGGRAYNLVDDDPAPRMAVISEARRILLETNNAVDDDDGVILPSSSSTASRNVRNRVSRGTGNKRCTNSQLKSDYGWTPIAPTFREGLRLLMEHSKGTSS